MYNSALLGKKGIVNRNTLVVRTLVVGTVSARGQSHANVHWAASRGGSNRTSQSRSDGLHVIEKYTTEWCVQDVVQREHVTDTPVSRTLMWAEGAVSICLEVTNLDHVHRGVSS